MAYDYDDDEYFSGEEVPRDSKIDEAKDELEKFFNDHLDDVYYIRQLEVLFEKQFFHWIIARAISELIDKGFLKVQEEVLIRTTRVKFVFHHRLRYFKRLVSRNIKIIREYSEPTIAGACGRQAEVLFCYELLSRGFSLVAKGTNHFRGKEWTKTNHNLDFIIEGDEVSYGCEVKNTFGYIDGDELDTKLEMCEYFKIRPLFIMRFAPKTYINRIIESGGFALIYETQVYPFGNEVLVSRIKTVLGMPVDCPRAIPDGIIQRFMRWHNKTKTQ